MVAEIVMGGLFAALGVGGFVWAGIARVRARARRRATAEPPRSAGDTP